jgi:hypothetical protein
MSDDLTKEDYEKTFRSQSRRIEMLEYETNILRAQNVLLRDIIVEALSGRRSPTMTAFTYDPDYDPKPDGPDYEGEESEEDEHR